MILLERLIRKQHAVNHACMIVFYSSTLMKFYWTIPMFKVLFSPLAERWLKFLAVFKSWSPFTGDFCRLIRVTYSHMRKHGNNSYNKQYYCTFAFLGYSFKAALYQFYKKKESYQLTEEKSNLHYRITQTFMKVLFYSQSDSENKLQSLR